MSQTFTASIWKEGKYFVAQCLEIDVASQGESEEEALHNLQEALELYLEDPLPSKHPNIHKLEVNVAAS